MFNAGGEEQLFPSLLFNLKEMTLEETKEIVLSVREGESIKFIIRTPGERTRFAGAMKIIEQKYGYELALGHIKNRVYYLTVFREGKRDELLAAKGI